MNLKPFAVSKVFSDYSVTITLPSRATTQMSNASTLSCLAIIKTSLSENNTTTISIHGGGIHTLCAQNAQYHRLGTPETEA